ncbi:protein FANTASTIC FOUR 3-like [Cocos nucifera]|uniref:Protein FANTASTIC FOUR 3-like n=1 Tax=Cocos nucifera TaxID=13894 RepID=A0A8K0INM4_COCNU|nr:protein FANTASTIC FOUR 3-like [Cocos nucifera]
MTDRPTLMESLSWNQIRHVEPSTATFEMFGEIQFREKSPSCKPLPTTLSFPLDHQSLQSYAKELDGKEGGDGKMANNPCNGDPNSNGPKNSETLQLCTEGLGFESFVDVKDLTIESGKHLNNQRKEENDNGRNGYMRSYSHVRSGSKEKFPPPITTIGRGGGRPWIYLKSYRKEGRFVLKEIRIPTQQCLQATRENGRLVLQLLRPDEGNGQENDEHSDEEE